MLQANIQYHSRVLKYYTCLTRVQLLREKIYSHSKIRLIQLAFCSCSGFECSELNGELRIAGKYTVLLACTAAFYVLDANGNPKQMRLRNTQTVRHFMHLRVIQMHACECEMRVNYAKSVNQNSSTACTETKVLVVRLKYWIFNSS